MSSEQPILHLEPGNSGIVPDVTGHQSQLVGEGDRGYLEIGLKPGDSAPLEVGLDPTEDPGARQVKGENRQPRKDFLLWGIFWLILLDIPPAPGIYIQSPGEHSSKGLTASSESRAAKIHLPF
jgi:hypothetical protein